jgi:DNA-binding transcriptional regulator PaaX
MKKRKITIQMIPRPEVTVAHIALLALAQKGRLSFRELMTMPVAGKGIIQRTENSFYTALARLKRRRQIIRTPDRKYELTQAGEYAALKAFVRRELVALEQQKSADRSRAWDGKWRIAIFDIPESKRPLRDYLRGVLKRLGCQEFQRSMWMHPHRLPPFVAKLFDDPQIRRYARLITTSDIDYDDDLRRKFKIQ